MAGKIWMRGKDSAESEEFLAVKIQSVFTLIASVQLPKIE
jgi:hypothetical protein